MPVRPSLAARPWEALPVDIGTVLRLDLVRTSDEVIAAIHADVPAYARPLEGSFGRAVRTGVEQALRQFVEMLGQRGGTGYPARDIYVELGRGEARQGRSLEALLAAYRIGARVTWRRIAEAAHAAGLDPETVSTLAESIFAYIDELSAQSAEGHAEEQSAAAGEAERRRRALLAMLVQARPAEPEAVEATASEAGWSLPVTLAALVWRDSDDRLSARLPLGSITAPVEDRMCALVPDAGAPGRRQELAQAVRGSAAVLGPIVPWPEARRSYERALAGEQLLADGLLAEDGLVVADEHLSTLLLHHDRALVRELAELRLAPLQQRAPAARARLTETLIAWLDNQGCVADVAAQLGIHPQTVRYRLGQLRADFGDALEDSERRFELMIALRAH